MRQIIIAVHWIIHYHVASYILGLVTYLAMRANMSYWLNGRFSPLTILTSLLMAVIVGGSGVLADKREAKFATKEELSRLTNPVADQAKPAKPILAKGRPALGELKDRTKELVQEIKDDKQLEKTADILAHSGSSSKEYLDRVDGDSDYFYFRFMDQVVEVYHGLARIHVRDQWMDNFMRKYAGSTQKRKISTKDIQGAAKHLEALAKNIR